MIALVGNPDIKDKINIMTALLLILNIFDIYLVMKFGKMLVLYVINISDNIIIGNIDGTKVLYQI